MIYCSNCGNGLSDDDNFCTQCGTQVEDLNKSKQESTEAKKETMLEHTSDSM